MAPRKNKSAVVVAFDLIDKAMTSVEKLLICLTLSLMLGFASVQVFLRNFFDSGIPWADIFIRHLVLFLLFFGASLSTRDKRHIQMDVSAHITPKRFKPFLNLFINAFCILINFYLYKSSQMFMVDERASGSILFADIPTWYFIAIMPAGFAMITLRFALNWIENLLVLIGVKQPHVEGHEALTGS